MKKFKTVPSLIIQSLLAFVFAVPLFAARGQGDFARYVAIGDSLTAGSQSTANVTLVETRQKRSFPALIARQAGVATCESDPWGCFQQPLISEPGITPELEIVSFNPLIIAPKSTVFGVPLNLFLARPYNNLGIPAARATETLRRTGAESDENPFYQIVLRGLGTAVDQALAQQPTFLTLWIGNNDVLGAVTGSNPLTPVAEFRSDFSAIVGRLVAGAPNAGVVIATVPPVTSVPFVTTIPPFLIDTVTGQPLLDAGGNPVYYISELGDGTSGSLPAGSFVTLRAHGFLKTGYGIPAAFKPLLPHLPDVGTPLPDSVTLTPSETARITARHAEINGVIEEVAAAHDIPVLDSVKMFGKWQEGVEVGDRVLDITFITGGLISLDGFHPSDVGYALIADEFIKLINKSYDTKMKRIVPHLGSEAQSKSPSKVVVDLPIVPSPTLLRSPR